MYIFIQLFYSIVSNVWCFFTNLHFSSIIQHSCMENDCSSCPWTVSEFASHQYCFCVVRICGHCVHTKHKKVRSTGKVSCSSRTRANTGCAMPYCMVIHFLCFCEWRYQRWSDSGYLLSDPILFLKNDIRIRSESCFGWNHTIRIRKLSKSALWCTTYIFVLCLFCLMRKNNFWSYFAFSWTWLVETIACEVWIACPA